jgi:four helix bundle protein
MACLLVLVAGVVAGPRFASLEGPAPLARNENEEEHMFIALQVSIEVVQSLRAVVSQLATRDRDLADQIRRAASSVALNVAEGSKRAGKDQAHHYRIAAGSAAEVRAAVAVGAAWGDFDSARYQALEALLDRQAALLYRIAQRR